MQGAVAVPAAEAAPGHLVVRAAAGGRCSVVALALVNQAGAAVEAIMGVEVE